MEIATTIAADVQGMLLRDDGEEDLTIDHFGLTIRDPHITLALVKDASQIELLPTTEGEELASSCYCTD